MNTTIIVILTILIIASFLTFIYLKFYNTILYSKIRVIEAEDLIVSELNTRYEIIQNIKKTIEKNTKMDLTIFNDLEKVKTTNISSYEIDRQISKAITTIYIIKNDYPKLDEKKDFKETIRKLKESDTKIQAAKDFYNNNNNKLISMIKSFPTNILAFIHKIKIKPYYDVKEVFNEKDDGIKI